MNIILFIILYFCFLNTLHSQIKGGNVWIIATNIYQYQNNGILSNLDYSSSGAYEFAQLYDSRQLTYKSPIVLVNRHATRESIIGSLNSSFISNPNLSSDDMIIFYFSGHGGMAGSEIGVFPYDYSDVRDLITDSEIIDIMNKSEAKHKICFIEACKSSIIKHEIYTPNILNAFNEARKNIKGGLAFITSAEAGKETYGKVGESGYFTKYLLKGLEGECDKNHDQIISVSEIFGYIETGVKIDSKGAQVPQINKAGFDPSMPVIIVPKSNFQKNYEESKPQNSSSCEVSSTAADEDCASNNVGDFCFCNTTSDNFIVSINANGVALQLSPNQTQCLYNYKSGSYNFHIMGNRDYNRGQAIIYGVSGNYVYIHDRSQFFVEKCKTKLYTIQ